MSALLSIFASPASGSVQGKPSGGEVPGASGNVQVAQFMALLGQGAKASLTQTGLGAGPQVVNGAGEMGGRIQALGGAFLETGGGLKLRSDLASDLDAFEAAVMSFLQQVSQGAEGATEGAAEGATEGAATPAVTPAVTPSEAIEGEGLELSPELLDVLADVLGAHVAAFDAEKGTNFSARLQTALSQIEAAAAPSAPNSGKAASSQSPQFFPAAPLVSEVVSQVARVLGVERRLTEAQPTATQTLLMFQPGGETFSPAPMRPAAQPLQAGWSLSAEPTSVAEAVIARSALSAGDAKSILEQIAAPNGAQPAAAALGTAAAGVTGSPGGMPTPLLGGQNVDFQRLDLVATLHHSHSDAGEITRFEDALAHTAKARADHVGQQSVQPRFANLILSQMKNATFQENRMRIELAPRGLGEISISVETDASGRMQAMIRVENPQVLEMLKADRSQLETLLSERGFDLAGGSLDFDEFERGEGDSEGQGGGGSADALEETQGEPDAAGAAASVISDTHLDILT